MKKQRKSNNRVKRAVLIIDSSTIIVLWELGKLNMLEELRGSGAADIIIPEGVLREFEHTQLGPILATYGQKGYTYSDESSYNHTYNNVLDSLPGGLGPGEKHVIETAYRLSQKYSSSKIYVVTDDLKARKTCRKMGIGVIGTLGLIEFSKKHGVISKEDALNMLNMIPKTSLYLKDSLLSYAKSKIMHQTI